MTRVDVSLTEAGYLHLPAEIARRYFPHDLLAAVQKPREVWLLPTRGAGAGGLILKQRNPGGDRALLLWHLLPPDTPPGPRPAFWDEAHGALRVAL
ncbi:MAG: hypothetical protein R2712_10120 [Vicinamibacterales bacterium]